MFLNFIAVIALLSLYIHPTLCSPNKGQTSITDQHQAVRRSQSIPTPQALCMYLPGVDPPTQREERHDVVIHLKGPGTKKLCPKLPRRFTLYRLRRFSFSFLEPIAIWMESSNTCNVMINTKQLDWVFDAFDCFLPEYRLPRECIPVCIPQVS